MHAAAYSLQIHRERRSVGRSADPAGVPAVFLDRDGTVNRDVGYLGDVEQLALLPGVIEAIKEINRAGFPVVILTNQSGVGRGYFQEEGLHRIHERLKGILASEGARVDGIYYCPHHPEDGCDCRKPGTGMIEQASRELGLNVGRSYVVGDKATDVEMARNAGAKPILVLTGSGEAEREQAESGGPVFVAASLPEAVHWILTDLRQGDGSPIS